MDEATEMRQRLGDDLLVRETHIRLGHGRKSFLLPPCPSTAPVDLVDPILSIAPSGTSIHLSPSSG